MRARSGRRGRVRGLVRAMARGLPPLARTLGSRARALPVARGRHVMKGRTAMPEADTRDDKSFYEDIPAPEQGFFLKGSGAYDWGMKNRLARIFRPESGRTVMLAIDHGYFQGPVTGLERVDLNIVPIAQHADALMLTRG